MKEVAIPSINQAQILELVLIKGDLSSLSPEQKVSYLKAVCESVGLNPLTKPFEFIVLNGKLTLYAKRDATDQLRRIHKVSVKIMSRETVDEVYVVTAQATLPDGRVDESIGAVSLGSLKGDNRANAIMKAETKSKRRVTLSICGLGFLDETEVETIPHHAPASPPPAAPALRTPLKPEGEVGDYVIPIGKKYKGMKLKEVDPEQLFSFATWLRTQAREKNDRLQGFALELVEHIDVFLANVKEAPDFIETESFPFEEPK